MRKHTLTLALATLTAVNALPATAQEDEDDSERILLTVQRRAPSGEGAIDVEALLGSGELRIVDVENLLAEAFSGDRAPHAVTDPGQSGLELDLQPLTTKDWVLNANEFGGADYTFLLSNPNPDHAVEQRFTIELLDADGSIVATSETRTTLAPGSDGVLSGFVNVGPEAADVTAEPVGNPFYWTVDSEGNQLPYLDLEITDVETGPSPVAAAQTTFCIDNPSDVTLTDVRFSVLYYSDDGILGSASGVVPFVQPSESCSPFRISTFGPWGVDDVTGTDVFFDLGAEVLGTTGRFTLGDAGQIVEPGDSAFVDAVDASAGSPDLVLGLVPVPVDAADDRLQGRPAPDVVYAAGSGSEPDWRSSGRPIAIGAVARQALPPPDGEAAVDAAHLDLGLGRDSLLVADIVGGVVFELDDESLALLAATRITDADGALALDPRAVAPRPDGDGFIVFDDRGPNALVVGQTPDRGPFFSSPDPTVGHVVDAAASDEFVFLVDDANREVQQRSHDGILIDAFGQDDRDTGETFDPAALAVGDPDSLFVTDLASDRILVFDVAGSGLTLRTTFGGDEAELVAFDDPGVIAATDDGIVIVGDRNGLAALGADGSPRVYLRLGTSASDEVGIRIDPLTPSSLDIAFGEDGRFYVADATDRTVTAFELRLILE